MSVVELKGEFEEHLLTEYEVRCAQVRWCIKGRSFAKRSRHSYRRQSDPDLWDFSSWVNFFKPRHSLRNEHPYLIMVVPKLLNIELQQLILLSTKILLSLCQLGQILEQLLGKHGVPPSHSLIRQLLSLHFQTAFETFLNGQWRLNLPPKLLNLVVTL